MKECSCFDDPMNSKCGVWEENVSACICVSIAIPELPS